MCIRDRRCSSLEYTQYSRSSRLAARAPRSEIRRTNHADTPLMHWTAAAVFLVLFSLVTMLGFMAARWRRGHLYRIDKWGFADHQFHTSFTWFLLGGDLYTDY